jgi:hypothetical protein
MVRLQSCTRKTRLLDVVYNSSNNELVSAKVRTLPTGWVERKVGWYIAESL